MSVIIPITRRDYIVRPSVAVVPLPSRLLTDPVFLATAGALGIDAEHAEWGGITLVASLDGESGRSVLVSAWMGDAPPTRVRDLALFALGNAEAAVSQRFRMGEGSMPVGLRLPLRAAQVVAAVVHEHGRHPRAVVADLRRLS